MKPRTRANGEGTIYKNPNETFTAQYQAPPGSIPARPSKTFTTQRKAQTWLTQQKREIDTGDWIEPAQTPLGVWWDMWVELYRKRKIKEATADSNKYAKKRLSDNILKKAISRITTDDIQAEWNRLDDDGLSRRTIELTRTPLSTCMAKAVALKKIRSNPVTETTLPDDDSRPATPLTVVEEKTLVDYCLSDPAILANSKINLHDVRRQVYKDALLFIDQTGVRRSECLDFEFADWTDLVLHIRGTKNESSDRFVPATPNVINMLKRRQETATGSLVFTTTTGSPLSGRNLLRFLTAFNGHKVHELRHTYCTRAAQAGINPKVLQTITGHKKIETLLKFYTHVTDDDRADAAAKIFGYCKSTANSDKISQISG